MSTLVNIILIILLILFTGHIYVVYRSTTDLDEEMPSMTIERVILLLFFCVGHGYIAYVEGFTRAHLMVLTTGGALLLLYILGAYMIDYLEPTIWHVIAMLQLIGGIMLHRLDVNVAVRQGFYGIGGFLAMLIITVIVRKIKFLDKMQWLYFVLSIGLLLIANSTANGSTNWFAIKQFSFQPSEFVKILFAFALAAFFRGAYTFRRLVIGSVYSAVLVLILVYQRDLGSALLFFAIYMVLSYMYCRKRYITIAQLVAFACGSVLAYHLFGHVARRIDAWMHPFSYIDDQGHQIVQGLFAFAYGKWTGAGLFEGMPYKIPAIKTDYIFAAIGEELGSIIAILTILLFLFLIIFLLSQGQKNKDIFKAYVSVAMAVMLGLQGFIILGGVIKLIPLTGVTLPFVSYGGTSIVTSTITVGLIEVISKMEDESKTRQYRAHTLISIKIVFSAMFMVLISYFSYFLIVQSDQAALNSYNPRLSRIEEHVLRGRILDIDGNVLAYSQESENGQVRHYPYKNMYAHAVGYVDVGKTGIEAYENLNLLNPNRNLFEQIRGGILGEPRKGSDIYLSLDQRLQEIAYKALEGQKGAVVAMDPQTGQILAMVSKPDYDPNLIATVYQDLIDNEEDAILLNRVTNGVYPPGSTFKILTALEYVKEHGEVFSYVCKGFETFATKTIHCYGNTAHGSEDLTRAFAVSCNTAFATMGEALNMDKLQELGERLLFNQDLPYAFNHVRSSLNVSESMTPEMRVETVIGQGETLITPLHNLLIVSAIANGGQLMEPYLVDHITSPTGKLVEKRLPKESSVLFDTSETALLKSYMEEVVQTGTGRGLLSDDYTAAGKTGSAENPFGLPHAWFVGFAPVDQPRIAVAIVVENAGSSGRHAVPVAKSLFDAYLIPSSN